VFNATFNYISVISRHDWWMKSEYPEKITDLPQVHLAMSMIQIHNVTGDRD